MLGQLDRKTRKPVFYLTPDNRIDTLQADLSTDRVVFGPIHVFLIINHSKETYHKIISDRISIRIILLLH